MVTSSPGAKPAPEARKRSPRRETSSNTIVHGPSRAVVENIGRAGARVVLVGADGALGDVVVPSPESGEALVEAVENLELAQWDAETVQAAKIGAEHRRRMAGL